ncbi:threonine synthase, partial [Microvirga sp. 3-52]|nr:threonine synthase [Microvirga sp. 3-52]
SKEGVFAEPGSCASIAGVKKQVENGSLKKGTTIVAVLTGNGLKDPDTAIDVNKDRPMLSREQFDQLLNDLKAGKN